MALLKIRCPECNAPLKSSAGFTVGEAVSCPKCETDFTVKEPEEELAGDAKARGKGTTKPRTEAGANDADWDEDESPRKKSKKDDDDDEPVRRSYKDSPLRFVILGILVVTMLVLAYMLYDKKKKEREAADADNAPSSGESSTQNGPIPPPPGGPIPGPPPAPIGMPMPPMPNFPPPKPLTISEAKNRLVGTWESKLGDGVFAVEYKSDGTFTYTATPKDEDAKKTITGRWNLQRVQQAAAPGVGTQTTLFVEWITDEEPSLKGSVVLRPDQKLQHPLLEQSKPGSNPSSVFSRK